MGMITVGDWKCIPARKVDAWVVGVDLGNGNGTIGFMKSNTTDTA